MILVKAFTYRYHMDHLTCRCMIMKSKLKKCIQLEKYVQIVSIIITIFLIYALNTVIGNTGGLMMLLEYD